MLYLRFWLLLSTNRPRMFIPVLTLTIKDIHKNHQSHKIQCRTAEPSLWIHFKLHWTEAWEMTHLWFKTWKAGISGSLRVAKCTMCTQNKIFVLSVVLDRSHLLPPKAKEGRYEEQPARPDGCLWIELKIVSVCCKSLSHAIKNIQKHWIYYRCIYKLYIFFIHVCVPQHSSSLQSCMAPCIWFRKAGMCAATKSVRWRIMSSVRLVCLWASTCLGKLFTKVVSWWSVLWVGRSHDTFRSQRSSEQHK